MNISWNLIHGQMLWFNLKYAFIPHPPLFFFIVGALLKAFGNDLVVIRCLTAFYGVLTSLLLFCAGKEMKDERTGLLMGFLYAIYPNAVFFNRIGFANNQLSFLLVLTLLLCLRYCKNKNTTLLFLSLFLQALLRSLKPGGWQCFYLPPLFLFL